MMRDSWQPSDLAKMTNGHWTYLPEFKDGLHQIEIDHRNLKQPGLFAALAGAHHDGHDFVSDLSADMTALVSQPSEDATAAQLVVDDVLNALQKLASHAMAETKAVKIAVTGSVGKTSTKYALHHILSAFGNVHASAGNYNNHIGAPLSMVRASSDADYIIIEMGMNHAGEISPLSHLFDGTIAIITKIAESHIGHFDSLRDIAAAKAEIFDGMADGLAILPFDDDYFPFLKEKADARGLRVISFGFGEGADVQCTSQITTEKGQILTITDKHADISYDIELSLRAGHHTMTNLIVAALLSHLSLPVGDAKKQFESLEELAGRGRQSPIWLKPDTETILIDDSYNAGPASMKAALATFAGYDHRPKALILTDMLELGGRSDELHQDLVAPIMATKAQQIILIGPAMSQLAKALAGVLDDDVAITTEHSASSILDRLPDLLAECQMVLVKGSNGSGAPQIASYLHKFTTSQQRGAQNVT